MVDNSAKKAYHQKQEKMKGDGHDDDIKIGHDNCIFLLF